MGQIYLDNTTIVFFTALLALEITLSRIPMIQRLEEFMAFGLKAGAYSNITDSVTSGYENLYSAKAGGDFLAVKIMLLVPIPLL